MPPKKDIVSFFGKSAVKRKAPISASVNAKKPKPEPTSTATSTAKSISQLKVETTNTDELSAEDVLKTIPDADPSLLVIDPEMEGKNFFQLKAVQGNVQPTGHRDIPEGRPGCLLGLTIVFTGVLPSIDRNECERIAQQYGAKVTKSISGKTSCVVIGREAGPSKIKKIKSLKTKVIDEDGFIKLLESMPSGGGSGSTAQKARAQQEALEKQIKQEAIEDEIKAEKEKEFKNNSPIARTSTSLGSVTKSQHNISKENQLWTVRYAPTEMKHICGNKGNVEMLYNWLETWFQTKHELSGGSIDNYRSILISGPPGIGKTTSATLIAKKLGYDVIETNASDFRSKKLLNEHLKVTLDNSSVAGFFDSSDNQANRKKICLIMDEVDGMSSGDNGGLATIAQFCRTTKTPMILICNDKSLPKMRTLDKYCFDMVWRRPTARDMKSRLMSIAHREGLKLDPNLIDQLVQITHNDIRQIINIMSTVARTQGSLNFQNLNDMQSSWEKEVSIKPFEIIPRLLSPNRMTLNEKIGMYFNDMDIIPLMIHENYKMVRPTGASSKIDQLKKFERAADYISESDLINSQIRGSEQQWSLLPFHAVMSTVLPSKEIQGQVTGRIMFTSWLGQNSKRMKFDRIVQNLQYHTCTKTHSNNSQLRSFYVPYLKDRMVELLSEKGSDGIPELLELMDSYYLTKDDFDNIMELSVSGTRKPDERYKKVPTSVKSAFTRKYNSYAHPTIIYKTGDSVSKRGMMGSSKSFDEDTIDDDAGKNKNDDDDDDSNDNDNSDDLVKDNLIKAVKPKKAPAKKKKTASKK